MGHRMGFWSLFFVIYCEVVSEVISLSIRFVATNISFLLNLYHKGSSPLFNSLEGYTLWCSNQSLLSIFFGDLCTSWNRKKDGHDTLVPRSVWLKNAT